MPRPRLPGSCNTCRSRKVKCDQALPVCQKCSKAGRYCDRTEPPPRFREVIPSEEEKTPRVILQDQKIARLFHHYIADLAPWYDLSDETLAFGTAVPSIALDEPLLFFAVIALSAMHACRTTAPSFRSLAESYHHRCVRLLIVLSEGDDLILKGIALAATCLLRSYEILDNDIDANMHLRGAYSMASFENLIFSAEQHGLVKSGFWNYLREDITFSLYAKCPLKMDLEFMGVSSPQHSDQDYLNSISLILGKIINVAFHHDMSISECDEALAMVQTWAASCPPQLKPFSTSIASPETGQVLPAVWFLQSHHASTMHYYLLSLTIIAMHASPSQIQAISASEFIPREECFTKELLLESLALQTCGIAFTAKVPSVLVNAFGPMAYCAQFIRNESCRQELIRQLLACKSTIGWPVEKLVENLKSSWRGG